MVYPCMVLVAGIQGCILVWFLLQAYRVYHCMVLVAGIQGAVWTEMIRTPEHLHHQLFPRLLALAERAWHRAPWEEDRNR